MSRASSLAAVVVVLMARPAAAQSFPVKEIPPQGITFTVQCDPPIGYRKADGSIVPLDLARLAYALSVDAGPRSADQTPCSFSFTLTTAGDHPVDLYARYRNDRGEIETSLPAHLLLQLVVDETLTLLPPTNVVIQIRVPPIGTSSAFTVKGHEWALRAGVILRDGAQAPDSGIGCTELVPAADTVAAFCPDGNWWVWVEVPEPPAPHWTNAGPRLSR